MHGLSRIQGMNKYGLRRALLNEHAEGCTGTVAECPVFLQVRKKRGLRLLVVVKGIADTLQIAGVPPCPRLTTCSYISFAKSCGMSSEASPSELNRFR